MNATAIPHDDGGLIMAEWKDVMTLVYDATERTKHDFAYAESLDLEFQMVAGDTPDARLLRAVARKMIPPKFLYAITPALGGNVFLTFQGLNSGDENEHVA